MSDNAIIMPLSEDEKKLFDQCEEQIARGIRSFIDVGEALMTVRDNELYREKYRTWENYCEQRWGFTDGRARQLILAMGTAKHIEGATGVTLPTEAATRELRKYTPEDQTKIAVAAAAVAAAQERPVTSTDIKTAAAAIQPLTSGNPLPPPAPPVDPVKQRVYNSKYAPIKVWMDQGRITPKQALSLDSEIEACAPMLRGWLFQMQVMDALVVRELSEMARNKSETLEEIRASGHLEFPDDRPQIHISKATVADLKQLKEAKRKERLAQIAAARDAAKGIESVIMTLHTKSAQRNADLLISMMGSRNARELARALQSKLWKSKKKHRSHVQYVR
jgi:hypothetical protein